MNTVVFQAMPRWDHPYASTAINVAKRLAKKNLVFYVERPYTWRDVANIKNESIKRRLKFWLGESYHRPYKELDNFIYIVPKPQIPVNFLPESKVYQKLLNYSNKSIWKTINKVLDNFEVQEFTYVNSFDPTRFQIYTDKKVLDKFYHCVDNIAGERYIAKHGIKAEAKAVKEAKAVITTSKELAVKYHTCNLETFAVENGVDFSHFESRSKESCPEDLAKIDGIKLLYVGNIGLRIDYDFIEIAAKAFPQWNWVMVGPKDEREFKGSSLLNMPNIHFLGKKTHEQIPAYIYHANACILPFECNELTRCIYPLKINEYFACGKPVLSTRFANLDELESQVHFYDDLPSFERQVNQALHKHTQEDIEEKKRLALINDWDERTSRIEEIILQEHQKISETPVY